MPPALKHSGQVVDLQKFLREEELATSLFPSGGEGLYPADG